MSNGGGLLITKPLSCQRQKMLSQYKHKPAPVTQAQAKRTMQILIEVCEICNLTDCHVSIEHYHVVHISTETIRQ
jgi:hypothetical protein